VAKEAESLLEVKNLTVEFETEDGILRAVDNVSFTVGAGMTLGLVGESGCGKSVTAMSIPRLVPQPPGRIVSGEILFQGEDLLKMPVNELRKARGKDIGVIFQEPMTALSPLRLIGEQIAEVILLHTDKTHKEALSQAQDWLYKVGIPDPERCMTSYPYQLSGGMRQRVMIAMALVLEPKLIIADEPTTALDVTIQAQILELMHKIKGADSGLLLITHDMGVIWEMCQEMAVMYASRIVEYGKVKELFEHPLHPYTQGLMKSIPALNAGASRLPHISGQVPSLLNLPKGCAFAARCPLHQPECDISKPMLEHGHHAVACFRA